MYVQYWKLKSILKIVYLDVLIDINCLEVTAKAACHIFWMGRFQCFCLQGLDVKVVATRALLAGFCFHAYQQVGQSNELDSKFWGDYCAVNHTKYDI